MVVAAIVGLSCRPPPPPEHAAPVGAPAIYDHELVCKTGLRVRFESTPAAHLATVMLIVDAGSTEDPPGREGLAHLVEHLSYRVSNARQVRLHVDLSGFGVAEDGATSQDSVEFSEIGPAYSLPFM